jgi:GntR family transcriptional regulator
MHIHLSDDGLPKYLQIVNQVKYLVAAGRLAPGEELPPIRVLAERLVINPNTVQRAYRELEKEGYVTKRGTAGTYVSDGGSPLAPAECLKRLAGRADALLADAAQMGVGLEEVLDLVRRRHLALQIRTEEDTNDERR